MKIKYLFLFLFLFVFSQNTVFSQSYAQDTVWTKVTDQWQGFWMVKFSNHDSIIVGHGYGYSDQEIAYTLFYNSINGDEITRIPSSTQVFFFNNDDNFIRLNETRNCFEIYNARTFQVVDTLENDSVKLIPNYVLSKDESKLVSIKSNGIRIWNMMTKKIMLSKNFLTVPGLKKIETGKIDFNCDGSKILVRTNKTYQISSPPYETYEDYVMVFNANTLDSIDSFYGLTYFELSHNCQLIAFQMANENNGVVIYNFITKKIKKVLPINGFSLTGIEFSPDDKYIVTSNGPGLDCLNVWEVTTGIKLYGYTGTSFSAVDISHNGKYLINSVGRYLDLIKTKFNGTPVPIIPVEITVLYPNPTTGLVNIDNITSEKITIYNSNGALQGTITPINSDNGIRFNVSNLPNGEYILSIEGKENKTYKLIIIK